MKKILIVTALLLFACVPALADLCPECSQKMFTADIGKCANCGADTSSGGKQLCPACSEKLHQCEACRMPIQPPSTAPATQP